MGKDLKKMYRTVMDDHFPPELTISFGNQVLTYRKRTWKISDEKTGEMIEKGLRYGENPGQEAALYELIEGNLALGGYRFIEPGNGLVSAISEKDMIQSGKHPGKINLTDVDNALNIIKYLTEGPAVVIVKHNNPCGVAYGTSLEDAYKKADMADRIAAFGGCAVFNRPMDTATAGLVSENYLEVVAAPDFEEGAIDILAGRPNLRIIQIPKMDRLSKFADARFVDFKSLMDGGIIVQQSPVNVIRSKEDFQPAACSYQGRDYAIDKAAHGSGICRYAFRLAGGTGSYLQLRHLCKRRCHGRNRHGRARQGRRGRNRNIQGLYQICGRALLPNSWHSI